MGEGSTSPADNKAEYKVKSAFLYNFAKYVTWPKEAFEKPQSPIVLGIIGEDPFGKIIDDTLEDKKVGKRPVVIKRLQVEDVEQAHILFIGELEAKEQEQVLKTCKDAPILIVGDQKDFAVEHGMVNFYIEKKKVRFECNPDAAKAVDLTISSQLLKLARIVESKKKATE